MGRDFGWLLSPLERAVGYPIRAPNEPLERVFLEHRWR